jgi:hypothetical protein
MFTEAYDGHPPRRSKRSERAEHAERSVDMHQTIEALAGQYLARVMERQSHYFDMFLKEELTHLVSRIVEQVVDQVVERLAERFTSPTMERLERSERGERSMPTPSLPPSGPSAAIPASKSAVLTRLRAMQKASPCRRSPTG